MSDMGDQPPHGWSPAPPGPPGYGPPPGFAQPAYGYVSAPPTEGKATAALVCAILSFGCPLVLSITALVLAGQAARSIRDSMGRLGGTGLVTAARIVAWINIAVSIAAIAFFVFVFSVAAGTARQLERDFNTNQCQTFPYESPPPGC